MMISFLFLVIIMAKSNMLFVVNGKRCSKSLNYEIVRNGMSSLPSEEIISSHKVEPSVQVNCNFLCYEKSNCVGFNFRTKTNAENCQLTYTTRISKTHARDGEWILFHDVDVAKKENRTMKMPKVKSCADLYKLGVRQDGLYTIDPDEEESFKVMCDMHTDGGGWTVFQRRHNESVDFYRGWQEYKNGFGNLNGNFWLGLDKIHRLTKSRQDVLRIDLMDCDGNTAYAKYLNFTVSSELDEYELNIGSFAGDAGDSLTYHSGMKFSTKDRDNDLKSGSCALSNRGAWWYGNCHYSHLNGVYIKGCVVSEGSNHWLHWKNSRISLKKTEMKMRPIQF